MNKFYELYWQLLIAFPQVSSMIYDKSNVFGEALRRNLVGKFECSTNQMTTLSDVRRWWNRIRKITHGLSIQEIGDGRFLFEFASQTTTEQVKQQETGHGISPCSSQYGGSGQQDNRNNRRKRQTRHNLDQNCWTSSPPLGGKIFKAIGDSIGGCVETEETELRNHLKWARI